MVIQKIKKQISQLDLQRVFIGLGVIFLVIAGILYFTRTNNGKNEEPSASEQVFIEEDGFVRKSGEEKQQLSQEEAEEVKQEVKAVLEGEGVEQVSLSNQAGVEKGSVKRAFSDGRFYLMASVQNLEMLSKGYYYGGWLMGEEMDDLFTGRVGYQEGQGTLYYLDNKDLTEYSKMVITLEPENGDDVPGEIILSAEF